MEITDILLACDSKYGEKYLRIPSNGKDIFAISDLHLASGLNLHGNYEGTENFFNDDSFVRYIDHLQSMPGGRKAMLIINGDFIDFLRINDIPSTDQDFVQWQQMLEVLGIIKTPEALRTSIVKKEIEYGLKTHDYKSVWKLHVCMRGHARFFSRLATWLHDGNDIVITKGNHDLEWCWAAVRNYLRLFLAGCIAKQQSIGTTEALRNSVASQTLFADHAVIIDGYLYAEHGHRFDRTTAVQGEPLLANGEEINLPFGSFFNRYLINRLELSYPYLDNVRPTSNILLVLLRERFPLAIKVLFKYVPFMLLIIPKKLYWETFKYLLSFLLIIVVPVLITVFAIQQSWNPVPANANPSIISRQILSVVKNFGFLFLSYIFGRILVFVKIKPPHSFYGEAMNVLADNPGVQMVTFGHTHNPEQKASLGSSYYNTGTWIPVYESSSADVRFDKTFTFLHVTRNDQGNPVAQPLQRWNDDAMRTERMILTDKI